MISKYYYRKDKEFKHAIKVTTSNISEILNEICEYRYVDKWQVVPSFPVFRWLNNNKIEFEISYDYRVGKIYVSYAFKHKKHAIYFKLKYC